MTAVQPRARSRRRAPRRETELTFLRLVPGDSVVHRLWAGTKILVVAGLAIVMTISPSWAIVGMGVAIVLVALLAARIPPGAIPRLPTWFFAALALGAVLNLWSGQKPVVTVGPVDLSIGALSEWARFTLLALVLIASGAIIGWTTRLGDVAPALQRMIGPLRRLRMPVDEWIVAIALAIRCLPLLIDEIRTLNAARRLRTHDEHGNPTSGGRTTRGLIDESLDLLAAAIVASVRRARDLAEAIIARGGTGGSVSEGRSAPGVLDWFVLAGAAALYGVSLAVLHL